MSKLSSKVRSLGQHKKWLNQRLTETTTALEEFKVYRTSDMRERLDKAWDKVDDQQVKIKLIYDELHVLNPTEADTYNKQEEDCNKKVDELVELIAKTKLDIAKDVGTPVPGTGLGAGGVKCKPVVALKPETLQLDDVPAKLRVFKADFQTYYTESSMDRSGLPAQHGYFLACLSSELKAKVRSQIENLPVFSDDADTDTCFSVLEEVFIKTFPLVKRRQQYFEYTQHSGQLTSQFLEKLLELSKEADIHKLTADDHLVFRCLQGMSASQKELKEKILEVQDLDLDKLKKVVNAAESAKSCMESLNPTLGANKSSSRNKKNFKKDSDRKLKCDVCNRGHLTKDCKHGTDVECFKCHEKGHISPACPKKSAKPAKSDKSDDDDDAASTAETKTVSYRIGRVSAMHVTANPDDTSEAEASSIDDRGDSSPEAFEQALEQQTVSTTSGSRRKRRAKRATALRPDA